MKSFTILYDVTFEVTLKLIEGYFDVDLKARNLDYFVALKK